MLQKMHVLLLDGKHKTAHDGVVHRQDVVHAVDATVQGNHIAEHLREHLAHQRPSARQATVEVVDHKAHHRSLPNVLREEEVEVVPQEGVRDVLPDALDADVRTGDELHEEFVDELQVVPIGVQEGHLDVEGVVLDLLGEGERAEENVSDHSETVLQRVRKVEDIPVPGSANGDQLLDGLVANADLAIVPLVLEVELRAADADLAPQERSHLVVRDGAKLRQVHEDNVVRTLAGEHSNYA